MAGTVSTQRIDEVSVKYAALESAWNREKTEVIDEMLESMKLDLLNLRFLPSNYSDNHVDPRELLLARNVLEIGALWSITKKDPSSFERYYAQLKCYYFDCDHLLPPSGYKFQIIGLNLLDLLSQNRLAEFHTELELMPPEQLKNVYIKHPTSLEQFVMEGSYHKIFLSKGNVPAANYNYFIDILIDTVRDEIASCCEKAYRCLPAHDLAKRLRIEMYQLEEYAAKRNWVKDDEGKYHLAAVQETKPEFHFVRNVQIIQQTLGYVRELEKIV